jgi:hypothetical protein
MRRISGLLLFFAAGMLCFWRLWEEDLFHQIAAGNELLQTYTFPQGDTWSFTAVGEKAYNFQWLWTVILAGWVHFLSLDSLVLLRSLVVGCLFLGFLWRYQNPKVSPITLVMFCILFFAGLDRFQLRSELVLITLWQFAFYFFQKKNASHGELRTLVFSSFLLVLCWVSAQMHYGIMPLIFVLAAQLFLDRFGFSWRALAGLAVCAVCALSVHPYGWEGLQWIQRHILYATSAGLENPEHQILHFASAKTIWIVIWLASLQFDFRRMDFRSILHRHGIVALLVLLTIVRDRAILFLLIVSFGPMKDYFLNLERRWAQSRANKMSMNGLISFIAIGIGAFSLADNLRTGGHRFGWGLNSNRIPVAAITWLKTNNIKGPVFHPPNFGDAIIGLWPGTPVFIDTREMMYDKVVRGLAEAWNSPEVLQTLLTKYEIQTVFIPHFGMQSSAEGLRDRLNDFYPRDIWSFVYSDGMSMILLRRDGVNSTQARLLEIEHIRPHIPPSALFDGCSLEARERFKSEVDRCLMLNPDSPACELSRRVSDLAGHGTIGEKLKTLGAPIPPNVLSDSPLSRVWEAEVGVGASWLRTTPKNNSCVWYGVRLN